MACGTLSSGITLDCDDPIKAGNEENVYLINWDDWKAATVTYDGSNPLDITVLTMASGDSIYKIEGDPNTVRSSYSMSRENGRVRYTHTLNFDVAKDDVATKLQVLNIDRGRFVAIIFTNSEVVEVLGAGTGLVSQAGDKQNRYENSAVIPVTLATDEATPDIQQPASYTGSASPYDFATAKADITSQAV